MIKEVVLPDAHEGKSLARLTRMKWLVAAILVVVLALGWLASKPVRTSDVTETIELPLSSEVTAPPASSVPGAPASPAPGAPPPLAKARQAEPTTPTLTLERRVDGQMTARGQVGDPSVRDQWLNAIRIGAQGNRVDAEIDVAAVASTSAWDERLRQLTALTASRRLDRIHLEGERLVLQGPAVATSYRQATEQLFRAQLPDHFQVEYRTVSPATTRAPAPPPSAEAAGTAAVDGKAEASASTVPRPAVPASSTSPASSAAPAVPAAPVSQAQSSPAPGARSARSSTANCPARLDKLAANIYFRTDSVALSRAEQDRLGTLGRCLRNRRLSVVGFADSRHNSQYNLDLSLRRAQTVAAAIRAEAPDGASITTSAVGAEAGKSQRDARWSRRVEIRVR